MQIKTMPWFQAIVAGMLAFLSILICKFSLGGNGIEYTGAFIGIVFYVLMNLVISIFHPSFMHYTIPSIFIYLGLAAILLLTSKAFSGISIWELSSYRFMFTSVTIFYLTASFLVRVIRMIYEYAVEEDNF